MRFHICIVLTTISKWNIVQRYSRNHYCLHSREEYQIHFETCPTSSILTGSVGLSQAALIKHPIVQFAQDNVNFSINTDDTTVTDSPLENEYQLLRSWGFNEVHFTRAVSIIKVYNYFISHSVQGYSFDKIANLYPFFFDEIF